MKTKHLCTTLLLSSLSAFALTPAHNPKPVYEPIKCSGTQTGNTISLVYKMENKSGMNGYMNMMMSNLGMRADIYYDGEPGKSNPKQGVIVDLSANDAWMLNYGDNTYSSMKDLSKKMGSMMTSMPAMKNLTPEMQAKIQSMMGAQAPKPSPDEVAYLGKTAGLSHILTQNNQREIHAFNTPCTTLCASRKCLAVAKKPTELMGNLMKNMSQQLSGGADGLGMGMDAFSMSEEKAKKLGLKGFDCTDNANVEVFTYATNSDTPSSHMVLKDFKTLSKPASFFQKPGAPFVLKSMPTPGETAGKKKKSG